MPCQCLDPSSVTQGVWLSRMTNKGQKLKWGNRIDFPQYFQGHFSEFFENSIKGTPIVLFPEVSDTSSSKLFIKYVCMHMGFPSGSAVKNLPAMQEPQEMRVQSLCLEVPLEEGMATTPVFLPGDTHRQRSLWAVVHGVMKSQT